MYYFLSQNTSSFSGAVINENVNNFLFILGWLKINGDRFFRTISISVSSPEPNLFDVG